MAQVKVTLKNPPALAKAWQLIIYSWDELISISKFGLGITDPATFEIPAGWAFPLRVDILIYGDSTIYYRMHSTKDAFPQFYRAAFIPDYGSYYFNVSTEQFELIEAYAGTLTKKELEYNSSRGIIPVANVLQNLSGLFHVTARNDMSTSQPIGIYWFINDPDGLIVEEYTDWKLGTLGSGQTHEFIGGRFTFSKVGKYGTWVDLLMGSQSNPVVILPARYIGELCTVVTAVLEYKGSIARKELEYDSVRGTIPVY